MKRDIILQMYTCLVSMECVAYRIATLDMHYSYFCWPLIKYGVFELYVASWCVLIHNGLIFLS